MALKTDDVNTLPGIVVDFYKETEFIVKSDTEVKLKAVCRKCSKTILSCWKPTRVTSSLISHVKVKCGRGCRSVGATTGKLRECPALNRCSSHILGSLILASVWRSDGMW